jgi:hypothetical protein
MARLKHINTPIGQREGRERERENERENSYIPDLSLSLSLSVCLSLSLSRQLHGEVGNVHGCIMSAVHGCIMSAVHGCIMSVLLVHEDELRESGVPRGDGEVTGPLWREGGARHRVGLHLPATPKAHSQRADVITPRQPEAAELSGVHDPLSSHVRAPERLA